MCTPHTPARRFRRLDSATGPLVQVISAAHDGWVQVRSQALKISFETAADRLFPLS